MAKESRAVAIKEKPNVSIEAVIQNAIDKGVPVETMERLLAMRQQLKAEAAKEEYDRSMASFQEECPTIEKKKQAYNYKYAPLESIVEQVKGLLAKNGFSYTFDTEEKESKIVVTCLVKHIAGHSEASKTTIERESTTKMNASQQSGAAMTYGKRYAFCNAFGILTGDEDTDAAPPTPAREPMKATTVTRKFQSEDDDKQFLEKEEILEVQKEKIRTLLADLGYRDLTISLARSKVYALTGKLLEPENFDFIIAKLTELSPMEKLGTIE